MPVYKRKNNTFFRNWTSDMSYVLGFVAADGCLIKNKRGAHFLEITSTDKDIMYKIREVFSSNLAISEYQPRNAKWKKRYRLQIGSKQIYFDLESLGIFPRKNKTLKLPVVPDEYFGDFVRGYFDGDGCVSICPLRKNGKIRKPIITVLFTSGSRDMLVSLKNKLQALHVVKGGSLYYHDVYRLQFSIRDSFSLFTYMYNTKSSLYLKRKKIKFEEYFLEP